MSSACAVVFDLDDCLYLERDYVMSGFHAVASWLGDQGLADTARAMSWLESSYDEGVRGNSFDRLLSELQIEQHVAVRTLLKIYRDHKPKIQPCADALRAVPSLRSSYRIGLVSDGFLEVQSNKLDALCIRKWFDAIVLSDEFGRQHWKPDARPFEAAIARLNVEPSRSVYIGDNPIKDFLGARRIGMSSIRIRRTHGIYAELEPSTMEHAPDHEIESLDDLESALSQVLDG